MDIFISRSSHGQIHNPRNKCVNFKTGLDDMRSHLKGLQRDNPRKTHQKEREEEMYLSEHEHYAIICQIYTIPHWIWHWKPKSHIWLCKHPGFHYIASYISLHSHVMYFTLHVKISLVWVIVFARRIFPMWSLDLIQLTLEGTGGHSFLAVTLQSHLIRTEAQKKGKVGQICFYIHITGPSIITTGVKTTITNLLKLQKEFKLNSLELLKL